MVKIIVNRYICIILLILFGNFAQAGQQLIGAKAPEFSLLDQFDKPVSTRQLEGSIVVLIASDREGSVQNPPWKDAILNKFKGKVVLLGVADLRSVPFFLKSRIKKDFQKHRDSVLLDWDGVVFTSYLLTKKVSNVILIDRNGHLRYLYAGPAETEARDWLFREIEALL
jgi:hypothetical protein